MTTCSFRKLHRGRIGFLGQNRRIIDNDVCDPARIQQLKDRQYEAEAQTWEEMKKHVYQIADATADALAKQFAKKFA